MTLSYKVFLILLSIVVQTSSRNTERNTIAGRSAPDGDESPDDASPSSPGDNGAVVVNGVVVNDGSLEQQAQGQQQVQENEGLHNGSETQAMLDQVAYNLWFEDYLRNGHPSDRSEEVIRHMESSGITMADAEAEYIRQTSGGSRKRSAAITDAGIWTKCIIPYTFESSLYDYQKTSFLEQTSLLEKETGFRFYQYNNSNAALGLDHNNYLRIYKGSSCNCPLGNKKSNGQWCATCTGSTVIHELGHAFGMAHEQNLAESFAYMDNNYKAMTNTWVYTHFSLMNMYKHEKTYDPSSVMHYAAWAFKKDYMPTVTMMDPDFSYMIGSSNYYYLFKAIQKYNKCYDEFPSCSPLPVCEFDGYPSVIDGSCKCRCPEGLLDSSNCKQPIPKEQPPTAWPSGKFSFLKSTASPCPDGFANGTMYNYPAYKMWDGGDYHIPDFDKWEVVHRTCTKTEAAGDYNWPAGDYCILRYNGTCPTGFSEGKHETWGKTPTNQDEGIVPDGEHGQFFEYIFCCRSDGEYTVPISLPVENSFIMYRISGKQCQEVKGMWSIEEEYYTRSNVNERTVYRTGSLPYMYVYSEYTQYQYICVYFKETDYDCEVVKTLEEGENEFTFQTPLYPSNYPKEIQCMWHLKSPEGTTMQLDFEDFEVSYSSDVSCTSSVTVKSYRPGMQGFKFCGHNYKKTHYTVRNYLTVKFESGTGSTAKGFKARVKVLRDEDKCYTGDGSDRSYAAPLSYAKDFETCVPWNKVTHCPFHQFDSRYADHDLSNNYCRNIGVANQPWCYTNAEMCRRTFCDACMTGSCYDLFTDCAQLKTADSDYCNKNVNGEAFRGCKKTCNWCDTHVPKTNNVTCGAPPVIKGISATPVSTSYNIGDVVTYNCTNSTDSRESVCTSEGTWSTMNFVCGACPSGWAARNQNCYKYSGWNVNLDHAAATSKCEAYGGHLMQVDSSEKHDIFYELSGYYKVSTVWTWIGLTKSSAGQWVWPDGSALSWSNWKTSKSVDESADCVFTADYEGKWFDTDCTNKRDFICEYTPEGPFSCEDQLTNCEDIIRDTPDMCSEYTDYALANCRASCGVGDCSAGTTCTDDASMGAAGTRTTGSGTINVGQHVTYECADGYYQAAGDLSRACLPSGNLTGSVPVCSNTVTEITIFSDIELFKRSGTFDADYTYINREQALAFPVGGKVTSWTFYSANDKGQMSFQIFRPLADPTKKRTLTFVGENAISSLPTQRLYTYHVPEADQITVQPGDLIGFWGKGKEVYADQCTGSLHPDSNGWMYYNSADVNADNPDGASPVSPGNNGAVMINGQVINDGSLELEQEENREAQQHEGLPDNQAILDTQDNVQDQEHTSHERIPDVIQEERRNTGTYHFSLSDAIDTIERHAKDSRTKRSAAIVEAGIWTKCIIPYTFDAKIPISQKNSTLEQQKLIERETGFRFVPYNNSNDKLGLDHENYLIFYDGNSCNCPKGNTKGKGQWCSACTGSTVVHELGHAFGMGHEQNHPASFPHMDANYKAMTSTYVYSRWNLMDLYKQDMVYDPSSVMHYDDWGFKRDYQPTIRMMDPDFNYLLGSRTYYYLFKAIQEYNKCYDEYPSCSPLPVCDFDGYASVMEGKCTCRCPEGLDSSSGCKTPIVKVKPWPSGKFSFLKSTESPCPEGFETGTMYNYPAYWAWNSSVYHFENHDPWELVHKTCTQTNDVTGGYPWPAGFYCIHRYGGTCPQGFKEGKAEAWGRVPKKQDDGTVPDGQHGQFFEYIFCCRSDGDVDEPISLPNQQSFILYPAKKDKCQKVEDMINKKEHYYIRSNISEKMVYRTGTLPYIDVYSDYTQFVYYCVYFPKKTPITWPIGTYSMLKSTKSPCPARFEPGTMFYYPAYKSWDGGKFHFEVHNEFELAHKTCTKTNGAASDSPWPAGSYCILRYGGTCPQGFVEGKQDTWGLPPKHYDEGIVPDGGHGQFFEYYFCCRSDGEPSVPIKLPYKKSVILYRSNGKKCQEIKDMTWIEEVYYTRSNIDEVAVNMTGELPHMKHHSKYTQYVYYCVYFPKKDVDCNVVKTFSEQEVDYTFTTPHYPDIYPLGIECMWHLQSPKGTTMQLYFEDFELSYSAAKTCQSSVTVKAYRPGMPGIKFCGHNYQKTHWTNANYLTVKFEAGQQEPWKGFKARVKVLKDEDKCYKGDGSDRSYAGTLSYAKNFQSCLPWNKVTHCYFHQFDSRYADCDLDNNYCRNIGVANQPWCYTNAEMCTRVFCDACMTGSCFDLFADCSEILKADSNYCTKNVEGDAVRGCAKSCGRCDNHKPKSPKTCGPPPDVKGIAAIPISTSYKVGDVVTYKCPDSSDFRESVCTSEGTWTKLNFVCGACPSNWAVRDEKCYKYFGWDVVIDHASAVSACAESGARLIQTDSWAKQKILNDLSDYYPETVSLTWVGLVKNNNGDWVWPDGSVLSWNNWKGGQPTNSASKACVATDYSGKWFNYPCSNKYNVICEYTPKGPFGCEDQLSNCEAILRDSPDVCAKYPDYAWANCRLTCGVGGCSNQATCTDDAKMGSSGEHIAGSSVLSVGQFVSYKCADDYRHVAGDLSRACLPSGRLTGTPPVCSNNFAEITVFDDTHVFKRAVTFEADDTYINHGARLAFPRAGNVTSWTFYSHNDKGEIAFQIFRPLADPTKKTTLTFIGENAISPLPTQRVYTYRVPEAEQIAVQPGDLIGLYVKGRELSYHHCSANYQPDSSIWMYTSASSRPGEMTVGKQYQFTKSAYKCRIFTVKPTLKLA